jgi:hypothetical protein
MSLSFTETFTSSLNLIPIKKYDQSLIKSSKNYNCSRIILPEKLEFPDITLKFNKISTEITVSCLDFIRKIKQLLNIEKKFTLLKKGKVLKDFKCCYDYSLKDGDVLTIFYQKEEKEEKEEIILNSQNSLSKKLKQDVQESGKKINFIKELRVLLEKYQLQTLEKEIVNLLPRDY